MKTLLVGETNPYGSNPEFALYPAPEGSSGYRLCVSILGMSRLEYLESFDRVNLVVGDWDASRAEFAAREIKHERMILLGTRVCRAFGVEFRPFHRAIVTILPHRLVLVLPHPSGLCRVWNDPEAVQQARAKVASYAPEVAGKLGEVR